MTAFSQTGTNNTDTVKCFTVPVVRQIINDLLTGDSAKAELGVTTQQLKLTKDIVNMKDSAINVLNQKEKDYRTTLDFERRKYAALEEYTKRVENNYNTVNKELKKVKFVSKVKTYGLVAGILTGIGAYLYYFKFN